MKAEHEPVTGDEFVLRLVWGDYYKAGLPLPVQPAAFQPRDSEVEGISVFREAERTIRASAERNVVPSLFRTSLGDEHPQAERAPGEHARDWAALYEHAASSDARACRGCQTCVRQGMGFDQESGLHRLQSFDLSIPVAIARRGGLTAP